MSRPESDLSPSEIHRLEWLGLADEVRRARNAGRPVCQCTPILYCYACGSIDRAKAERESPSVRI